MGQKPPDETFYREVVVESTRPVLSADTGGRILFANEPITEFIERDPETLIGTNLTSIFRETAAEQVQEAIDPGTETGRFRARLSVGDSETDVSVYVAATDHGDDRYLTLTLERPRETNEPIRELLARSERPLFLFDPDDATVVDCNEQACELLARSAETLRSSSVNEFIPTPAVFKSFLQDVGTASEGRHDEFTVETEDNKRKSVAVDASPLDIGGHTHVFVRAQDVSEQNALRTQRRRRTAALDAVTEGVAILDKSFTHSYVNDAYIDLLGHEERATVQGEPLEQFLADRSRFETTIRPEIRRGGSWYGRISYATGDGTSKRVSTVFEELEDGSLVVRVGKRADNGRENSSSNTTASQWRTLNDVSRQLAGANDVETVVNACIDTVTDVLGFELGCLRLEEGNELEPVATTPAADTLVRNEPGFELGVSDAGRAYRTGEPVVRGSETETPVADLLGSSAHFPIGDHGVLTVATTDERPVSPAQLETVSLLAATVEAALARLDRDRRHNGGSAVSTTGDAAVDTTPDSPELVLETFTELIDADSRATVEERVCSALATAERYSGAWMGAIDSTGKRLLLREWDEIPKEHCAQIEDVHLSRVADGVVADALETNDLTVLDRSTLFGEDGPSPASDRESNVCIVPLKHEDKPFGVLGVHTPDSFGPKERRSLTVLGKGISFVLSAIENENLLLSDEFVELEFEVTDPDCLSVALSDKLDTAVSMKRTVRNTDDEYLSYVRVKDTAPQRAREAAESIDSISACRVINDHDYGCLLEVTRPNSGAEVMMEFGATMRSAEAESGRGTLVLEAPNTVDVRRIVDAYQSYNPQSELVTKRRIDRPVRAANQLRAEIEQALTKKQLSAVSTAYFSGYYEWPRESTAEEVAEAMAISASTLHQHLRHAHQKLLSSILEDSFSRQL